MSDGIKNVTENTVIKEQPAQDNTGENQKTDSPKQDSNGPTHDHNVGMQDSSQDEAWAKSNSEEKFEILYKQTQWSHHNLHRIISYIGTLEQWRHMPFYPTDKDGNALDKDGNVIDPGTGKITKTKADLDKERAEGNPQNTK